MIKISKSTVYFILVVILVLFLFQMQSANQRRQQEQQQQYGYDKENKRIVIPPIRLSMTRSEAELTRSAVALVEMDIHNGCIENSGEVLNALSANLPQNVSPKFLAVLGCPPIDAITPKMNAMLDSIIITDTAKCDSDKCSTN